MNRRLENILDLARFYIYSRVQGRSLRVDENKVLFLSQTYSKLDGNLKEMHDFLDGKDYELLVHVGDRYAQSSHAEKRSIMRDMSSAKYIFLDDFYTYTSAIKLKDGQKLIQLWHGAGAFKKFAYSRLHSEGNMKRVHGGYRKYTHVSVTSEEIRPCYAEAFDIPLANVKACGIPRTDIFFDEAELARAKERVFAAYPALRNKKIVLIAPTYRGDRLEDASYDFDELRLDRLQERFGEEYTFVTKWHPALMRNIENGCVKFELPQAVIDATYYDDINDLLIVADMLVTDYSSLIFEYSLMEKPIVFFAYDLEEYTKDRGFYFDYGDYVYGALAKNSDELQEAIESREMHDDKRRAFVSRFMGACDGKACERIYEWIFDMNR